MRSAVAILLLVLTMAARAEPDPSQILIEPPDPTSQTPIVITVWEFDTCAPQPVLTRNGTHLTIALGDGPCLSPPGWLTHRIEIGPLPAGIYDVVVTDHGGARVGTTRFTVLEQTSSIVAHPSVGSIAGGTIIDFETALDHCTPLDRRHCSVAVTLDGMPVDVIISSGRNFRIIAPPHAAGAVALRIVSANGTSSSYAFRYYDPGQPPLAAFFEKILIPILYNGPGVNGASWTTELTIRNANEAFLEPWHPLGTFASLAPFRAIQPASIENTNGMFLFVPRESAAGTHASLIVRDTSRESSDWGTAIPLGRESDFASHAIGLVNIPASADFRRTLRVYGNSPSPQQVRLTVYSTDTGTVFAQNFITTERGAAVDRPASATIDLDTFARLPATGRLGVTVSPWTGGPVWAFVSVTNNTTQRVTVISP